MAEIYRRILTDTIISVMSAATNFPVGDGVAPSGAGWQGQPNMTGSNFIPYTVVLPSGAGAATGSFADSQTEWELPYSVWAVGIRRDQCEAIADLARGGIQSMVDQNYALGPHSYVVQLVRVDSIGGITRYDQTDPPYWGQVDMLTLWLSKE